MYIQRKDIKAYSNLPEYMCSRAKSSARRFHRSRFSSYFHRVWAELAIKEMKDVVHL